MHFLTLTCVALIAGAGASIIDVSPRSTSTSFTSRSIEAFSGEATFYYQQGVAGACGTVHSDSDAIAALSLARYGNTNTVSPNCGKKLQVTNTRNGKGVTVTVASACPTCAGENDLDLSIGAFSTIAALGDGEVPITWSFLD